MEPRPPTTDDISRLLAEERWVRSLARSLLRDPAAADDVVQEAWLAAISHPPAVGRPLRPWLRQVVRNFAWMHLRAAGRRSRREGMASSRQATAMPDEMVRQAMLHRELVDEVLALEAPYRTVILMRFFRDMTPAEIASDMGVPASTVRVQLMRGLDRLRDRARSRWGDGEHQWTTALFVVAGGGIRPGRVIPRGAAVASLAVVIGAIVWLATAALRDDSPVGPRHEDSTVASNAAVPQEVPGAGGAPIAPPSLHWTVAPPAIVPKPFEPEVVGCGPFAAPAVVPDLELAVVTELYEPVSGANVSMGVVPLGVTSSDGRIKIRGSRATADGKAQLATIEHPEFATVVVPLALVAAQQTVVVGAGGSVRLKVIDKEDGKPIADAQIALRPWRWGGPADAPLAWRFIDGEYVADRVPSGVRAFEVRSSGRVTATRGLEVIPGHSVSATLALERGLGASVRVHARATGDAPWRGLVRLEFQGGGFAELATDDRGLASFDGLPRNVDMSAMAMGATGALAIAPVAFQLMDGVAELTVPEARSAGIHVVDPAGMNVNARVRMERRDPTGTAAAPGRVFDVLTDPDGWARLNLPDGSYVCRIEVDGVQVYRDEVLVEGTTKVAITVTPPRITSLKLVDENGAPLGGWEVMLRSDATGAPLSGWDSVLSGERATGVSSFTGVDGVARIAGAVGRDSEIVGRGPSWLGAMKVESITLRGDGTAQAVIPHWTATFEVADLATGNDLDLPVVVERVDPTRLDGPRLRPPSSGLVPRGGRMTLRLPAGQWRASVRRPDGSTGTPLGFSMPADSNHLLRLVSFEPTPLRFVMPPSEELWRIRWVAAGPRDVREGEAYVPGGSGFAIPLTEVAPGGGRIPVG